MLPAALLLAAFAAPAHAQPGQTLPRILVYKTHADYSALVQVELSADGSKVASYPAPADVTKATAPVKLKGGYWLSKAGVSLRTAFLKTSRKSYSKKKEAPSTAALYKDIRDRSPMEELWDCGGRGELTTAQINDLIKNKQLASKCKKVR